MEYTMSPVTIAPLPEQRVISYAGFWRRVGAYILDVFILAFVMLPIRLSFGVGIVPPKPYTLFDPGSLNSPYMQAYLWYDWIFAILWWLYGSLMESSRLQATLGKMALRIIVTDEDGNRINFGQATGRHFAKILSFLMLCIGFMMAGWTKKKQAAHDMIAGTLVIMK